MEWPPDDGLVAMAGMPFGRAASPAEIGNAVALLASPVSGCTTGTVLTIDGGG